MARLDVASIQGEGNIKSYGQRKNSWSRNRNWRSDERINPITKKTQYFIVLKTKKSKSTELVNLCMNVLNFYVTLYCTRDGVVCSI